MMVPGMLVQLLLPVAGMVSVFFLLRGHNEPGGGFVGGLIMATAIILQYLVGGTAWAESRTRIHPHYWIGPGLLCAAGAGLSAWLATRPFLSALAWDVTLPVIGELHLSTVLLFDLGVYFAGDRRHGADPGGAGAPIVARPSAKQPPSTVPEPAVPARAALPQPGRDLMEIVYALAIGVLTGSGVWLLLRPRTFQVIIGFSLLSMRSICSFSGWGDWLSASPRRSSIHAPAPTLPLMTILCPRRWC